jgi:hypothetical protein
MLTPRLIALAGFALAMATFAAAPAQALTMKECSTKYQAAKDAGKLGDMKWNDFRKKECAGATDDTADQPAADTKKKKAAAQDDEGDAKGLSTKDCSAKYQGAKEAGTLGDMKWNDFRKAECGPGASAKIDTKASKSKTTATKSEDEDAGKGLSMKDCSAKYQAAKEAGTLGTMKWNDFRKAECGPGASATADTKTKKTATKSEDEDAGKGLSMKDCSAKYQAAKEAGTLGTMKWNDFRKAECGPGSSIEVQSSKSSKSVAKAEPTGTGLTMKECSVKYQKAKTDGTLGDLKWNSFRKAKCGADAADDETVPAPDEASYTNEPETPTTTAPHGVKFPRAISSKYSSESQGKARMHTCLDQYYANKESNSLGGLKWIQKGGGFYSLCNSKLKGAGA